MTFYDTENKRSIDLFKDRDGLWRNSLGALYVVNSGRGSCSLVVDAEANTDAFK